MSQIHVPECSQTTVHKKLTGNLYTCPCIQEDINKIYIATRKSCTTRKISKLQPHTPQKNNLSSNFLNKEMRHQNTRWTVPFIYRAKSGKANPRCLKLEQWYSWAGDSGDGQETEGTLKNTRDALGIHLHCGCWGHGLNMFVPLGPSSNFRPQTHTWTLLNG